ncbi:MAG: ArsR/SmtB family transcription factor [Candidatus Bathyarchaeia archaeon]|nr:helix-turn-helix domain-containing protein [Candidatus Bathyarchaeota archaeon A05DMB-4]MDH7594825.1 metalloregulator ArsR/SmtB family transcription factor [Candidatus Bathyarchaeota archaeon]
MKPMLIIKDPEAFQLLADETRRKIIYLLRAKEMTVSQLAAELSLTPQAVYHHIKKLQDASMIEIVREERLGHLIESYYRATAESFYCSVGKVYPNVKVAKEQMTTALNALIKLGFKIEFDDKKISKLVELQAEIDECCNVEQFADKVADFEDLDLFTKDKVMEYASILSASDEKFARQQEIEKKLRSLLKSLIKKPNKLT